MRKLLVCAILGLPLSLHSQARTKTTINFTCPCEQPLAAIYATGLRDKFALSPRYMEGEATGWRLSVITLATDTNNKGLDSIAINALLTYGGVVQNHTIQTCGSKVIQDCVDSTFADMDQAVQFEMSSETQHNKK